MPATTETEAAPDRHLEEGFRDFAESLVQHIDEVFFWTDPDALVPYFVSNAYEKIWGQTCQSVYQQPSSWTESIHPQDKDRILGAPISSGEASRRVEYRIVRPDGVIRWVAIRTFPFRDGAGQIRRIVGIAQDYTEYKEAQSSQAFLASIVESSDDSIVGSDTEGTIRSWNHGAETLFGYARHEVIGKSVAILFPPEQQTEYLKAVIGRVQRMETLRRFETIRMAKGGIPIDVSVILSPIRDNLGEICGLSGIYRDIRDRKVAEQNRELIELRLRHAQKLESVGRLAAGVAHEINTPIQFVSDSVHFVKDAMADLLVLIDGYRTLCEAASSETSLKEQLSRVAELERSADLPYLIEQMPRALDRALDGTNRVATIVRSMKEFAHPDQSEKTATDLNRSIASTLTVARNEYKYVADLETEFGDIPPVTCQPGEINQVILNLVVNAAHAIADVVKDSDRKGLIRVSTRREENSVVVVIEDTGGGIPEKVRDRIFDPFFTTKEVGRGTGQGLAIARSVIVDKHGGSLDFETKMGRGTTFLIRLPLEQS